MTAALKTRVLFVDDEPLVLQGLQRMLRPMRDRWEMVFVESGAKAMDAMDQDPFHVVVSDMRMPGMNGAQLLAELSRRHPKTVRMILSGHADKNLIIQCVGTAHQFLAKPCEPEALKAAVARACGFEQSLKCERLKELITKMETLPSMPSLFHEIVAKLRDDNCSLDDVAALLASDLGITAKLLKLVNSAFFGLCRPVSNPMEAVSYLGFDTIKALVLAVNAFSCFEEAPRGPLNLDSLWKHSMQVGNWARAIARAENLPPAEVDECFISGMLHDVGKLALSVNLPGLYHEAVALASAERIPAHAAEDKIFGANHADAGGFILSLWGLPGRVVDAIAYHHHPSSSVLKSMGPLAAVHAANVFSGSDPFAELDQSFIAELGLQPNLEAWKSLSS